MSFRRGGHEGQTGTRLTTGLDSSGGHTEGRTGGVSRLSGHRLTPNGHSLYTLLSMTAAMLSELLTILLMMTGCV